MSVRFVSFLLAALLCNAAKSSGPPNIILVFIDDLGWGDFSCFGNAEASTPNIDKLAIEGIRFHHFYVNMPICSPSRVAISTGQYPQRHRITSFLNNRQSNLERGIANWLDPTAPMLSRMLNHAGYATAHFGKWHMGGQRDVDDAPKITNYGFDTSLTNFEGMGAKLLPLTETPAKGGGVLTGRIWEGAERLGEPVQWMLRSRITGGFADRAVEFVNSAQSQGRPFYVNVWPDDVHTPFFPSVEGWSETKRTNYLAVLEEMDLQLARLFNRIAADSDLRDNTLILVCSDNGPEAGAGSAGPFRGGKGTLFEGGIRSPLIVWAPGLIDQQAQGLINETSVFAAIDLVPSLLHLAGVPEPQGVKFDGENLAQTIIGKSQDSRSSPLFFRRPPDRGQGPRGDKLPDLAVREGKWKLVFDYDGSHARLYDLTDDQSESNDLAKQHPDIVKRLIAAALMWNQQLPPDAGDPRYSELR